MQIISTCKIIVLTCDLSMSTCNKVISTCNIIMSTCEIIMLTCELNYIACEHKISLMRRQIICPWTFSLREVGVQRGAFILTSKTFIYTCKHFITLLKIFERQKLWTLTLAYYTVTCTASPHMPITIQSLTPPTPPHPKKVDSGSTNGLHTLYTVTVHTKDKKAVTLTTFMLVLI